MPTSSMVASLSQRVWNALASPTPPMVRRFTERLTPGSAPAAKRRVAFSLFDVDDADRARDFVGELMSVAQTVGGSRGVQAAIEHFERTRGERHPDLESYALMAFIAQHPAARALAGGIPPLPVREPEKTIAMATGGAASNPTVHGPLPSWAGGSALPSADGLEWYREDPFASEHHEHWHVVFVVSADAIATLRAAGAADDVLALVAALAPRTWVDQDALAKALKAILPPPAFAQWQAAVVAAMRLAQEKPEPPSGDAAGRAQDAATSRGSFSSARRNHSLMGTPI